jgi:hypothetical protein
MGSVRSQARSIDSPGGIGDAAEEPIHAVALVLRAPSRGSCQIRSHAAEIRLIDVVDRLAAAVDFGGVGGRGKERGGRGILCSRW